MRDEFEVVKKDAAGEVQTQLDETKDKLDKKTKAVDELKDKVKSIKKEKDELERSLKKEINDWKTKFQ